MSRNRKTGMILILLGIAIIAVPFLLRHFQEWNTRMKILPYEGKEQEDENQNHKDQNDKKKDATIHDEDIIGIIKIPSLNIKLPIYEGADPEELNKGVGHMKDTAALCTKGNAVCAGHNGSRRGVFFTYLCNIEEGAKVFVITKEGVKHEYAASEMRVVSPYDAWVTEESEDEELTLFTCANHGTRRFVVKCERVLEEKENAKETAIQSPEVTIK